MLKTNNRRNSTTWRYQNQTQRQYAYSFTEGK